MMQSALTFRQAPPEQSKLQSSGMQSLADTKVLACKTLGAAAASLHNTVTACGPSRVALYHHHPEQAAQSCCRWSTAATWRPGGAAQSGGGPRLASCAPLWCSCGLRGHRHRHHAPLHCCCSRTRPFVTSETVRCLQRWTALLRP